jgi:hypothetical protein
VLKSGASLIPIFGSYFNASTTAVLHGGIGWGLCEIYEKKKPLGDYTKDELKAIFTRNKEKAKVEKEKYDLAMSSLPSEARKEVEALQARLKDRNLTEKERNEIMEKISTIFEKHGVATD